MTADQLTASVRVIWQDVIGVTVTDDADFFDIGGDSLAAMRIYAQLSDAHGITLPLRSLFDNSRFADFMTHLAGELKASGTVQ